MKGCQQIAVVQASYLRNLRIYNNDHEDFWNQVDFKLKHSGLGLCRFFDAGRFELDNKDLTLKHKGSINQREIDVQESLKKGEIILINP